MISFPKIAGIYYARQTRYDEYTMAVFAVNQKARFDYEIFETYEAGIALFGFEVKSIQNGGANLAGSFVTIREGGAWLLNAAIAPYQSKNTPAAYDPARSRRLLLHKSELDELIGKTAQKGLTLVPLRMYTKGPRVKLEFALVRRRKKYDKREIIKKRDIERETGRSL